MYPWLRMAKVLLRVPRRSVVTLDSGSSIDFRVWPNDLDLNGHMTNSRYLALMDAARYDMVVRAGAWGHWRKNGWFPVVASQSIRFRRSLGAWQRYTIETRILGWDSKNMYMGQRFVRKGELCAEAVVRAAFLTKTGRVDPNEIMAAAGHKGPPPQLSDDVKAWAKAERSDAR
jgi:acyl-CoA thioesterase FadM